MGTISDKLNKLIQTKTDIKNAIIGKGISVNDSDPFSSYASKISQIQGQISSVNINSIEDLKAGWKYKLVSSVSSSSYKSTAEAAKKFDDSSWTNITIPHDWSIYNEFNSSSPSGYEGGFLDGGDSWYRRKLTSLTDNSKKVFVYFDGVYKDCDVYINGSKIGSNRWYNPFYFDITSNLNFDGNDVLAVFVRNQQPSSRWYSGSGIIRNVYLLIGDKSILGINDIYVTTPNIKNEINNGIVNTNIKFDINNISGNNKDAIVKYIISYNGNNIVTKQEALTISNGEQSIEKIIEVPNPVLWDEYKGNIYQLTISVDIDSNTVYNKTVNYGYRYFEFTSDGFYLNGRKLKLKGVCLHHDLGCIGAEVNYSAIERQIKIMKDMGCNAIRITHNPASSEILDICAKEGIMVIEELFDCWTKAKVKNDFSNNFNDCYESVINTTVNRSKNNPSIIMYSIGNEILRIGKITLDEATTIVTNIKNCVKSIDKNLLITMGDDTPTTEISLAIMDLMDVIGINYGNDGEYVAVKNNYPDKPIYGSETTSALTSRGEYVTNNDLFIKASYDNEYVAWGDPAYKALKRHMASDYICGMFVWTGFDYIGEPTPYNVYPTRSSYFGIVDLAGFPKDIYYMYQSRWTNKPMIHILPHWTQKADSIINVWLYSNCYKVALYLNGSLIGEKLQSNIGSKYEFSYNVNYKDGTLVANGYDENNNLVAQDVLFTSYSPKNIELKADKSCVNINSTDLVFIECNILDKNGTLCPTSDNEITFTCSGGSILGTDNGCQFDVSSSLRNNIRKAYNGKCLAIIKPNRTYNDIVVTATSDGLTTTTVTIRQNEYTSYKYDNIEFIDALNPPIRPKQEVELTSLSLNYKSTSIPLNGTLNLIPTYTPTNTTQKELVWTVSPSNVATVLNGLVTPLTTGNCTIRCESSVNSSIYAECALEITESVTLISSLTLSDTSVSLNPGETKTISVSIEPADSKNKVLTWSCDNSNVTITPNENSCEILGVTTGISVITVSTTDGSNISAKCNVNVNKVVELEDYTVLRENYKSTGTSFVDQNVFDGETQTFFADITIDTSVESQNIISIGADISKWVNNNKLTIHTYNLSASSEFEIDINGSGSQSKKKVSISGNNVLIAINKNGIAINGTMVTDDRITSSIALLQGADSIVQFGSAEGSTRSISTYNTYGFFDRLLTAEELAQLTKI